MVFLSQLLLLFNFCHFCKESNPLLETRQIGTMAEVTSICSNPKCRKEYVWKSQSFMPGTKMPAGNLLLSFAILVGGGSASKVMQIFKHMGLACISLNTFFVYQRVSEYVYTCIQQFVPPHLNIAKYQIAGNMLYYLSVVFHVLSD